MHANELVELAALLSNHRDALLLESDPSSPPSLMEYWGAAKARHCRWAEFLGGWQAKRESLRYADTVQRLRHWKLVTACVEEILLAEIPTRVFAATSQAIDDRLGIREWSPVTASIFERQHEFRHRAMRVLLLDSEVAFDLRLSLDRLRRRVERWTDFLLAPWSRTASVERYAFDVDRLRDFAETVSDGPRVGNETYWTLARASLANAFRQPLAALPFSARLNRQLATAMLGCFPQALLALDAEDAPAWVPRLLRTARQTERLLDSALRPPYRTAW